MNFPLKTHHRCLTVFEKQVSEIFFAYTKPDEGESKSSLLQFMESTPFWIVPEIMYSLQLLPKSVNTYSEQSGCGLSFFLTIPLFFNLASALRIV